MSYHSTFLDKDFDSAQALVHEEAKERLRRSGDQVAADDAAMRAIPIEDFRALCERGMRSDAEKMAINESISSADVFTQMHPEYLDTKKNGDTMRAAFGLLNITTPTQQQYEEVYERCRAQGLLELDPKVLKQQREAATQRKAEAFRAANTMPSEEEMYEMDMTELRLRANGIVL